MTRHAMPMRALLLAALMASPAFADGRPAATPDVAAPPVRTAPPPTEAPVRAQPIAPAEPAATPTPVGQTGSISLPADTGLALTVPNSYRYYDAAQAQAFAQRNGAAIPAGNIVGLLLPAGVSPTAQDAWGTIVAYQPIGHVPTDGAARLTDPALEAEVRAARTGANRPFEGFAVPPAFAEAGPNLNWAERSAVPGAGGRDLRHEVRLLGRNGVASLTTIGSADQMPAVAAAADEMLRMVAFGAGQRHGDFVAASDTASTWDLASLVTGVQPGSEQALVADAASAGGGEAAGSGGMLGGAFPWIAGGVIVLAGAGYLVARAMGRNRREDDDLGSDEDPNLTPSQEST